MNYLLEGEPIRGDGISPELCMSIEINAERFRLAGNHLWDAYFSTEEGRVECDKGYSQIRKKLDENQRRLFELARGKNVRSSGEARAILEEVLYGIGVR